ncbi:MAG: hypothetical protein AB7O26_12995 [Planctomycetaceae bacterium]
MTTRPDRYYRDSGAVPLKGTMLMLFGGIGAACAVSFAYAALARFNPYIFINAFGVIGFGCAVGFIINRCARWGAVRNRKFLTIVGLALAALAVYFSWMWYIFLLMDWNPNAIILEPWIMWQVLQQIAANGLWSMGAFAPRGWQLYGFWLLEAGIVFLSTVLVARGSTIPYCEACARWTTPVQRKLRLQLCGTDELREELEAENYQVLDSLAAAELNPNDHYEVDVYRCDQCSDSNFLGITRVQVSMKDGSPNTNRNNLIQHIVVPNELVQHLDQAAAAQAQKEAESLKSTGTVDIAAIAAAASKAAEPKA